MREPRTWLIYWDSGSMRVKGDELRVGEFGAGVRVVPEDRVKELEAALRRLLTGPVGRVLDTYPRYGHPGHPAVTLEHIDQPVYDDAMAHLRSARRALKQEQDG